MKTLFPWLVKDPRLHLPVEVGGFGYIGRGLAVSNLVRRKLAVACSRGCDWLSARSLFSKKPFREESLFPRPYRLEPTKTARFYRIQKDVAKEFGHGSATVPLEHVEIFRSILVESEYLMWEGPEHLRRVRDAGRPARTKQTPAFRSYGGNLLIRPLGKWSGLNSIRKLRDRLRSMPVPVPEDIASEIRDRIPDPVRETGTGMDGAVNEH